MLWPDVTSPVARRVLVQLFNSPYCKSDRADISDYGAGFSSGDLEYAHWLRNRLRNSTLAAQLAAGSDAIPEIADAVEGVLAQYLKQFKPRTVEQYVDYLAINLKWVLEPSTKPDLRPYIINGLFLAAWVVLVMASNIQPLVVSGLLSLVMALFAVVIIVVKYSRIRRGSRQNILQEIHTTELYWHLRQVYSDSGFPDASLPDPAHPHITT
jgi:hypothetical protein